ncbi:MAG TPA: exodeoxyribonuclease III [Flavobacteriales bacterium]|jgi:exodeoxyribonuclease-3|nr:exodeoxyribonuclease III [Flavobacteriales bacterium]
MQITSWNVNGLRAIVKKDFTKIIEQLNPDILCLQETKAQKEDVFKALKELENTYKIYANAAEKKGYSGTAVLTKPEPLKVTYGIGIPEHDNEGRVITLEYQDFYLVNVYTPNAGQELKRLDYKAQWNKDFQDYVVGLDQKKPVIIAGDLNVAHQAIDLKNPKSNYNKTAGYTEVEIQGFSKLLKAGFIDTFRYLYPDRVAYTYWSYRFNARARNAGWRIDYFLVSKRFIDRVEDVIIHDDIYGSDHCPISLLLKD